MSLIVKIKKRLKDFSLEVDFKTKWRLPGILGPSGSGKSIALKCIAGVETPDEGYIILNGKVLFDSEKKLILSLRKERLAIPFRIMHSSSYDSGRKYRNRISSF